MGIRGFSSYVRNNQLLDSGHHLHDTPLVIDGLNLVNTLYFKFQRDNRNDHMYGGDYTLWSVYVMNFFNSLKVCGIVPIVILDGSFDPTLDKLATKLKRFKANLSSAFKIYKHNCLNEGINPALNSYIFRQVMKMLGVHHYQSIYEADDIIPQIARDLNCPILSNDSDFLISDCLPAGVIPIDFLIDHFRVLTHEAEGESTYKYLSCSIYRLPNIKRKFPSINLELIQLAAAALGNDYIDVSVSNCILSRIPKYACVGSNRMKQINSVLKWISKYDTYEHILGDIRCFSSDPKNRLIKYIEEHYIRSSSDDEAMHVEYESIDEYFEANLEKLFFFKRMDIPLWVHRKFVKNALQNRILSIHQAHIEWFRPLVEDFSLSESSYECVYDLCLYIYGLLRSTDENVAKIKRYSRRDTNLVVDKVSSHLYLDDQLLPKLKDIEHLSEQARFDLFYRITALEPTLVGRLHTVISSATAQADFSLEQPLVNELIFLLLALIYLSRHFSYDLWLEFLYALYANILLSGHFCAETVPVLLKLDVTQRNVLHDNFFPLNKVPQFNHARVFMPRVVHFYNSFQNTLHSLTLLAQVLNLSPLFHADRLMCTLKGSLIYNLTTDLCQRSKPLLHLEELMGRQKFAPLGLFHDLLDCVLENGARTLLINGQCDKDVVPSCLTEDRTTCKSTGEKERQLFWVRAFEQTNRKTHINSQKLKLRSNRSRR